MENKAQVDVLYTDFSKSFDKVSIVILIKVFESYGITGSLLVWLKSYLSSRRQFVKLEVLRLVFLR